MRVSLSPDPPLSRSVSLPRAGRRTQPLLSRSGSLRLPLSLESTNPSSVATLMFSPPTCFPHLEVLQREDVSLGLNGTHCTCTRRRSMRRGSSTTSPDYNQSWVCSLLGRRTLRTREDYTSEPYTDLTEIQVEIGGLCGANGGPQSTGDSVVRTVVSACSWFTDLVSILPLSSYLGLEVREDPKC